MWSCFIVWVSNLEHTTHPWLPALTLTTTDLEHSRHRKKHLRPCRGQWGGQKPRWKRQMPRSITPMLPSPWPLRSSNSDPNSSIYFPLRDQCWHKFEASMTRIIYKRSINEAMLLAMFIDAQHLPWLTVSMGQITSVKMCQGFKTTRIPH